MNTSILHEFVDVLLKNILFQNTLDFDNNSDDDDLNDI